MPKARIVLVENRTDMAMLETTPRYDVMLDGVKFDQLFYNMQGYRGLLPTPDGRKLDIGERGIGEFRKHVARLNREWAAKEQKRAADPVACGRSVIAILIDECGGVDGAISYADRIARARGPLSAEYAGYAATLRARGAGRGKDGQDGEAAQEADRAHHSVGGSV